jgi:DNA-binding response OmpR family regulator
MLHRHQHTAPKVPRFFAVGGLEIDFIERRSRTGLKTTRLTPKEADLLQYLVLQNGRTVSHGELLEAVWGLDSVKHSNYLHVCITNLRKKIETEPSKPQFILTSPWFGYSFSVPEL